MRISVLALLVLIVTSCARHEQQPGTSAPAAKLSATDLSKVRWIEGYWRGSGIDQKPFFERYRFENETTLLVDSFPDETLEKVDDYTVKWTFKEAFPKQYLYTMAYGGFCPLPAHILKPQHPKYSKNTYDQYQNAFPPEYLTND